MPETRPPKDDIVRAIRPGFELRSDDDGKPPTMFGHFTEFDSWYEVDSVWEGHFIESIAPGAARKTISENRSEIRALFQHGLDFQVGDKPLGKIADLREDETGVYYEVPLLDAKYVRDDILPGLEAGLYGSSFRFKVLREEWVDEPKSSKRNPDKLPERTIKEFRLFEFGPVTFPANPAATAGVRSLTDEYIMDRFRSKPDRLAELIASTKGPAPSDDAGQPPTSPERRGDPPPEQGDPQEQDPAPKPGLLIPTPRLIRSDADWDDLIEGIAEWTN